MFIVPHTFFGNNEQIVIAHKIGFHSVFDPLVVIDIRSAGITAIKYNHYDIFDFATDKLDELPQITSFMCG